MGRFALLYIVLFGLLFCKNSFAFNNDFEEEEYYEDEETEDPHTTVSSATGLSTEEIERRLFHLFKYVDKDSDKKISKDELILFFEDIHAKMLDHDLKAQHESFDRNKDGKVLLDEVEYAYFKITHIENNEEAKEGIKKRFDLLSREKDYLGPIEVDHLLHPGKNVALLDLEANSLMIRLDSNNDNTITLNEWLIGSANEEDEKLLQEQFLEFDINNDGYITSKEIFDILRVHAFDAENQQREVLQNIKLWFQNTNKQFIQQEEFVEHAIMLIGNRIELYSKVLLYPSLLGFVIPGVEEKKGDEDPYYDDSDSVDSSSEDSFTINHDEL